jgi:hypothetical protein
VQVGNKQEAGRNVLRIFQRMPVVTQMYRNGLPAMSTAKAPPPAISDS